MNIKEYLFINTKSNIVSERNVFLLLFLEQAGEATSEELSTNTNLPIDVINKAIKVLYDNDLIYMDNLNYKITESGLNLLDKFGLAKTAINYLFANTLFSIDEKKLYEDILSEYRKYELNQYLNIINLYKKITKKANLSNNKNEKLFIIGTSGIGKTNLISSVLLLTYFITSHDSIDEKNHKLQNSYIHLKDYALRNNQCYTYKSWTSFDKIMLYYRNYYNNEINVFINHSNLKYCINRPNEKISVNTEDSYNSYNTITTRYINLINDANTLQKYFSENKGDISLIMNSSDLKDFSQKVEMTEYNTKLILSRLRSKIDYLLK